MAKMVSLPQDQAFSPGDDLWILSETSSALFRRMDWLINFQMQRALERKSPEIPAKISEILKNSAMGGMDFIEKSPCHLPMWLFGVENYITCRWLLLYPFGGHIEESDQVTAWWNNLQEKIVGLKVTNLRFFPSPVFSVSKDFELLKYKTGSRYSLVEDSNAEIHAWI